MPSSFEVLPHVLILAHVQVLTPIQCLSTSFNPRGSYAVVPHVLILVHVHVLTLIQCLMLFLALIHYLYTPTCINVGTCLRFNADTVSIAILNRDTLAIYSRVY